jgi:ADP-ribosylglycohydrolase
MIDDHAARLDRALLALDGLSLGDSFGERFFGPPDLVADMLVHRRLPAGAWRYTDDSEMSLAIVDVLRRRGLVDRDALAAGFARRYARDPMRGYGGTAHEILQALVDGADWRVVTPAVFSRPWARWATAPPCAWPPIGAYFADDLDRVVAEARASADPTHAHPDGQAGAIAVAVAAAVAWQTCAPVPTDRPCSPRSSSAPPTATPAAACRSAARLRAQGASLTSAAEVLGTGYRVISSDTVPFALLCASLHLDSFAGRDVDHRHRPRRPRHHLRDRRRRRRAWRSAAPACPRTWLAAREPLGLDV